LEFEQLLFYRLRIRRDRVQSRKWLLGSSRSGAGAEHVCRRIASGGHGYLSSPAPPPPRVNRTDLVSHFERRRRDMFIDLVRQRAVYASCRRHMPLLRSLGCLVTRVYKHPAPTALRRIAVPESLGTNDRRRNNNA